MNMKKPALVGGAVVIATVIVIAIVVATMNNKYGDVMSFAKSYYTSCTSTEKNAPSASYKSAAVTSDASPCAHIVKDMLVRGGNTVDAAIAGMFCVGVINAQSSGVGGGFIATYYSKSEKKVYTLDAREVAPLAAYPDMYNPDINTKLQEKSGHWWEEKPSASLKGGLSVAVPGEVSGLWEMYQKFGGSIPWKDLIEPTIGICEQGYNLTWYTGGITQLSSIDILSEPSMSIFTNKEEKRALREGETVTRPQLAQTLREIQRNPQALQTGILADQFVEDLQSFGGIITKEDLALYKPVWRDPVKFHLENGNFSFYSFPPPGSGLLVGLVLNILDEFNLTKTNLEPEKMDATQQIVAEAMKYAFARRYQLGDLTTEEAKTVAEEITSDGLASAIKDKLLKDSTNQDPFYYGAKTVGPDDQGTAHLSVIGPNGDAVAITSSINFGYGAGIRSVKTGIIYNNQMDDFSKPESFKEPGSVSMENNLIMPGKRPLSSMSPTIVLDKDGNVRLCLGAAGGKQIVTAIAWVAARNLFMGENLKESVDSCRSHHQLEPMALQYEMGFPQDWISSLESKGHVTEQMRWKSVVGAVARQGGSLMASADFRKSGEISGF